MGRIFPIYIGEIEITLRELIFSVVLLSLLAVVGFLGADAVEDYVQKRNLVYRTAAQIDNNPDEFAQALATDVGHAFVEGGFKAIEPVSHCRIGGKWAQIVADHQVYTMHHRTVTRTVGSGKNRHTVTRVVTYWSWDTRKVERIHAKGMEFSGVDFDFNSFDYSLVRRVHKTVKTGSNRRVCFSLLPTTFHGSVFTELKNGRVTPHTTVYDDVPISSLYEDMTSSCAVTVFWIIWTIVSTVLLIGFFRLENFWLED